MSALDPLQIAAWKKMTNDQKWALVRKVNALVRQSARNRYRRRHPDISPEALEREVSRFITRSRT